MAGAGVPVGVGHVEIRPDLSGFARDLKGDLSRDLALAGVAGGRSLGTSVLGSFKGVLGGLAAAGGVKAAFGFIGDSIAAASDLNEAINKSAIVFGASADEMEAWSATGSKAFGLSKREALEAAGTFGNMFDAMGLSERASTGMSTSMVELASDLASFNNIPITEALERLRSGLLGEQESVERLGINMSETRLKAVALTMGLGDGKAVLDASAKAQAAYAIILEDSANAQGDFGRTSGDLANQQRTLEATWEDATAELGEGLLPAMTKVVSYLNEDGIPGFMSLIEVVGEGFSDAAGFFHGAMADLMSGIAQALEKIDQFTPGLEGVPEALMEQVAGLRVTEAALHDVDINLDGLGEGFDKTVSSATLFGSILNFVNDGLGESVPKLDLHAEATKDVDKATRDAASAERDLADARGDYNDLLARGPVDEEKVAEARQTLAEATRSAAGAERDLANAQERYDDALVASQVLHGFDTAQDALADASDDLADAQDNVASAHERAAEAAAELRAAQAGDPDYQDQLADARDRVADATDSVADANEHVVETSALLLGVLDKVGVALDTVGTKADTAATKVRPLLDPNGVMVGGVLGAPGVELSDSFIDAYGAGEYEPHPAPWTAGPRQPQQPDPALTPSSTLNTFNMTFNEKVDPKAVATEVSWIL